MAVEIIIESDQQPDQYRVTLREGRSETRHTVKVEKSYRDRLVPPQTPTPELLKRSFEFLLERESKESILRSFDLRVISRYFPEYEKEMQRIFAA